MEAQIKCLAGDFGIFGEAMKNPANLFCALFL